MQQCETFDGFLVSGVVGNCCYGRDAKSCRAQGNGRRWCSRQKANFCSEVFIQNTNRKVSETCDADCCNIQTGWGMGCPK
ncbi:hypothetical protein CH63R_08675 [Colletotrichum higginsianum IMI 349063]|uniref:Uncharacterized protein n=1 Tax=Colletotrichum higginsianum (strain IMI 349063) TaxID=759273 RepID=A0A1B7Y585_COLHI|nr:hypothetical protein CH63R_08675 [Colletotrichum higginsianum IMI 349063]OBR07154.1 hypothetical protein CH63R_08675 [Colletotrichum higginsianum IMI 349063]